MKKKNQRIQILRRKKLRNPNALMELYVHIPFCIKKCDYCDFLSGPANAETQNNYVEALLTEISKSGDFS